ncbi:MAG: NUDIX hydrolase [Chitinophagales bacterium]
MIDETKNPWQKLSEKTVYDNKWITVTHEDVITPTGTNGIYGKVHFKNYAIGIIPIDADGNTYLVGQYRYAINEYSWEIPEGGGLLENDILEAARRELAEEVGLVAQRYTQICINNTSNSATDELSYIFVAQDLTAVETQPDETEQLQIKKLSLLSAVEMAMDGTIKDAISIIGLLKLKILIDEGKFKI